MEARAAMACLGAHRRSPEAGERTLVSIEDSTTGHLFPVRERFRFRRVPYLDQLTRSAMCTRSHARMSNTNAVMWDLDICSDAYTHW